MYLTLNLLLLPLLLISLASCGDADQGPSTGEASSSAPTTSDEPLPTASQAPTPGEADDAPTVEGAFEFQGDQVSVVRRMESISGTSVLPDSVGVPGTLNFEGGKYFGLPVDMWTFGFTRGQMWFAQIRYSTKGTDMAPDSLMNVLHSLLTEKYGPPVAESSRQISRPVDEYSKAARAFMLKIIESYQGDTRVWPVGESRLEGVAVLNLSHGPDGIEFADLALFDRDPTTTYIGMTE